MNYYQDNDNLNHKFSNPFLNLLTDFNFDEFDCIKNFKQQMNTININILFDIYNLFGFDLETPTNLIISKWNELKKDLYSNKNNEFYEIYLNLLDENKNESKKISKLIQIKIIDSICMILSIPELKNIYDEYYLDTYVNYKKINHDKIKESLEKKKKIYMAYSNVFIKPTIKCEKEDVYTMENKFKSELSCPKYDFAKSKYKTKEELDFLYSRINKIEYDQYMNIVNSDDFYNTHLDKIENILKKINIHKTQIANIQINNKYMEFLHSIINKYEVCDINNLINYYNYWIINNKNNDGKTSELLFVEKFNYDNYKDWTNANLDEKNINLFNSEYSKLIELRKKQNQENEKYFDVNKLNYFSKHEFTLQELWNECDDIKDHEKVEEIQQQNLYFF